MPTNHRFICRTCTSVFFCLLIPSIARYKTAIKRNCIHGANPSFFYPVTEPFLTGSHRQVYNVLPVKPKNLTVFTKHVGVTMK